MGQGYSLTTLSAGSAGIDVPELSDLSYEASIGDARFMKTVRARHRQGLVVAKVVTKPYPGLDLSKYITAITRERRLLEDVPNVLAYHRAFETNSNGFLLRQYMYSSLYERLSTRPFLELVEKRWLAFQLLIAVRESHAKDVYHGDIKSENALVTSWNWLYLTDFSGSFKPVYLPEDNPADFSFFFDLSGRRTCYLAPERFISPGGPANHRGTVTWAMDIFSVGCVIAEMFLEAPLFNLSQLLSYRQGQTSPLETQLQKLEDDELREMITHMVQLEPEARYSADEYLNFWRGKAFPEYFYSFLHQYMSLITDPSSGRATLTIDQDNQGEADDRIARIYQEFDKISYFLDYPQIGTDGKHTKRDTPEGFHIHLPVPTDVHRSGFDRHGLSARQRNIGHEGTFILLTVVASSIRNTARAIARLQAIDLLSVFASYVPNEAKLDRVLPYLFSAVADSSEVVRLAALKAIAHLLSQTDTASPINAYTPSDYLLGYFDSFFDRDQTRDGAELRAVYAKSLASLSQAATRFSDAIAALKTEGSLPLLLPSVDGTVIKRNSYGQSSPQEAALVRLEAHTKLLLHDHFFSVRQALLSSIDALCVFFGSAKTNDVILSHLNTYVTEGDWRLKCSFFDAVVNVAVCVGPTSIEEFVLPLMTLALYDQEEAVTERALSSMARMSKLGLLREPRVYGLIDIVARLAMHPNASIRAASISLIASSTCHSTVADVHCVLIPMLKPFLKRTPTIFTDVSLNDVLRRPIARNVFVAAQAWAKTAENSTFWVSIRKRISTAKGENGAAAMPARDLTPNVLAKVPKTDEDQRWMSRLRDAGMSHEDEMKLYAFAELIIRIGGLISNNDGHQEHRGARSDKVQLPRQVLREMESADFDETKAQEGKSHNESRKTAQVRTEKPQTIADALLDASTTIGAIESRGPSFIAPFETSRRNIPDDGSSRATKHRSQHALLPSSFDSASADPSSGPLSFDHGETGNGAQVQAKSNAKTLMQWQTARGKANAKTSMSSTHVLGEVDGAASRNASDQASPNSAAVNDHPERNPPSNGENAEDSQHQISQARGIQAFGAEQQPKLDFGPPSIWQPQQQEGGTIDETPRSSWRPTGTMVAMFTEHAASVSCVAVQASHLFFITGSDDGCVKVWDTSRLERNVAHRSRLTYRHEPAAAVRHLCFIGNTQTFAAATNDGDITLIRVDSIQSAERTIKYNRTRVLHRWSVPDAPTSFVVSIGYVDKLGQSNAPTLLAATNTSHVHAINLRSGSHSLTLRNPIHHGALTTLCIGPAPHHWLLLGTAHGVLDLWDLRFNIRLRSFAFPAASPIHGIYLRPQFQPKGTHTTPGPSAKQQMVYVVGGTRTADVTVWNVQEFKCVDVYHAGIEASATTSDTADASTSRRSSLTEAPKSNSSSVPTDLKPYMPWNPDTEARATMLSRFGNYATPSFEPDHSGTEPMPAQKQSFQTPSSSPDRSFRALVAGIRSKSSVIAGMDSGGAVNGAPSAPYLITAGPRETLRFWDLKDERSFARNSGIISGSPNDAGTSPTYEVASRGAGVTVYVERAPEDSVVASLSVSKASSSKGKDGKAGSSKSGKKKGGSEGLGSEMPLRRHLDTVLAVTVIERPYPMVVSADRSGAVFVWA